LKKLAVTQGIALIEKRCDYSPEIFPPRKMKIEKIFSFRDREIDGRQNHDGYYIQYK